MAKDFKIMKKLLFLSLSLLLLVLQINAQKTDFSFKSIQFDNIEPELKGKVRTVLTSTYENNKVTKTTVETFDTQKRRQEFISHDADIEVHSQELVALTTKQVYLYDSKTGKLDSILHYDEKDKLWGKTKLIYDSIGLLKEENIYSENNKLDKKLSYIYDRSKNEIIVNWINYSQNTGGNILSSYKGLMQFSGKGRLIKRTYFDDDGKVRDFASFKYGENDLLMEENSCFYNGCSPSYSFEHIFDNHRNWIKRVKLFTKKDENGETNYYEAEQVFRTITYYSDNPK